MKVKKGVRGHYGDASGRFYGPKPKDQVGSGGPGAGGRKQHPNGGEVRKVHVDVGKMPGKLSGGRVTGSALAAGQASDRGLGKMPRNMSGGRQTIPYRRG